MTAAITSKARALRQPTALLQILSPILIVAIWWLWSASADSFFFPPLSEILTSFRENWLFERTTTDLVASLQRFGLGYLIAVVLGVSIGAVLGLNKTIAQWTAPVVEFMRALPPVALLPFTIVVVGIEDRGKVFLIVLGSIWPILLNAIDGMKGTPTEFVDAARSYGASPMETFWTVRLPSALPQIVAGMRSALSIALILTVISELFAATEGVGFFILQSQRNFDMPAMWSGMIMLSIVGITLNAFFSLGERRALRWYHLRAQRGSDS